MIKTYDFSSNVSLRNLMVDVLCGEVVILKDALDPGLIRLAVAKCHSWTNSTAESKNLPNLGGVSHLKSFLPARSDSRYIFNSLTFSMAAENDMSAVPEVMPIFDFLLDVYNRLFDRDYNLFDSYNGCRFLPQVIQYPRGGGFFRSTFIPSGHNESGWYWLDQNMVKIISPVEGVFDRLMVLGWRLRVNIKLVILLCSGMTSAMTLHLLIQISIWTGQKRMEDGHLFSRWNPYNSFEYVITLQDRYSIFVEY